MHKALTAPFRTFPQAPSTNYINILSNSSRRCLNRITPHFPTQCLFRRQSSTTSSIVRNSTEARKHEGRSNRIERTPSLRNSVQSVTGVIDHFNPPESTRPALLELPTRQEYPSKPRYLFRLGRAYLVFYKTGLQNIWKNRKLAKGLRQRIRAHQIQQNKSSPGEKEQSSAALTRAEFQIIRRSEHDVSRVPLFLGMFAVLGEFLPLVMALLKTRITPLLPYTVRLPSQQQAYRSKVATHREAVQKKYESAELERGTLWQYLEYGMEYFSLHPKLLPRSVSNVLPNFIKLRATMLYYEYLCWDDKLLGQTGVAKLLDEEVVIAAIERGLWDDRASQIELRERLDKSVARTYKAKPDNPLLGRP